MYENFGIFLLIKRLIKEPYNCNNYNSELLKCTERLFTPLHILIPFASKDL